MSDFDVKVNFGEMESRIQKLENDVIKLEKSIKNMKKNSDDLNLTWKGPNHTNFVNKFNVRYGDMEKFTKTLTNYAKILKLVKNQYLKVDDEVRSLI